MDNNTPQLKVKAMSEFKKLTPEEIRQRRERQREADYHNHPDRFEDMTEEEQEELLDMIYKYTTHIVQINYRVSSYKLKHIFETGMTSGYIGNGAMKGALLACGYYASRTNEINWYFNISKKSDCFNKFFKEKIGYERRLREKKNLSAPSLL